MPAMLPSGPRGVPCLRLHARCRASRRLAAGVAARGYASAPGAVPGAFPDHAYDPRKKSVGTSEYEQLRTNWAECIPLRHAQLVSPENVAELQQAVAGAPSKLRVVGSAHSFNHLLDAPDETLLSLAYMGRVGSIDPEAMTVSAEGGVTMGELCRYLAPRGCALHNVASFPHLTFVGAAATGSI
eukprot:SAG22_NODE_8259_length_670_cov_0.805604_1_plen_183_part_10